MIISPNTCLRKNFWQLKEKRNYKPFIVNIVTKLCFPIKMSRDIISWEPEKVKQQDLNVSLVCHLERGVLEQYLGIGEQMGSWNPDSV